MNLRYQNAPTHPALCPYVVMYGEASLVPGAPPLLVPATPNGCPALIVVLDGGWVDTPEAPHTGRLTVAR